MTGTIWLLDGVDPARQKNGRIPRGNHVRTTLPDSSRVGFADPNSFFRAFHRWFLSLLAESGGDPF
jgi:hypothetical protein